MKRLVAACVMLAACGHPAPSTEGFIQVPGGRIWYAKMGNGTGIPLIVIHGGPGSTSFGLKAWAALGDDRVVIRYDQLGCGKSDHPTDPSLFTVDRFVAELQALRDSLHLTEVHLYGRSWGAMLVEAYMATNPTGVRSVVLADPLVTTKQWQADADSLVRTLPDSLQRAIATHEAAGTTDSPEYRGAMREFYARYVRRHPVRSPADADSARQTHGDLTYQYMWGPSEFRATGTLKDFDATEWIKALRIPALFIAGQYDEATPASTRMFSRMVPGAEFAIIPNSAHSTENDNPDEVLRVVRDFIRRVEASIH